MELSVVIPCLNEADTLGTCVGKAQRAMRFLRMRGYTAYKEAGAASASDSVLVNRI